MATLALAAALLDKEKVERRKRNINFGFLPARPTRADLAKSRREFKARVRERAKEIRAERVRLGKSARSAFPGKKKLEALFHEVYGKNPRELPAMNATQMAAIDKYLRGQAMAAKKRTKKKKRNGKGKLNAGLRRYLAQQRAKKAKRNPRRKKRNPKVRVRTRTVVKYKYRTRTVKVRAKRRRKSNPRPRAAKRINLKGFTSGQLKRVASAIRRATGKRVRIVRPS